MTFDARKYNNNVYLCNMKRIITIFCGLLLSLGATAQSEQFAITLKVDSAIASEPQKV